MGRPTSVIERFGKQFQVDSPTMRAIAQIRDACYLADDATRPSDVDDSAILRRSIDLVAEQMAAGRLTAKRFLGNGS